MNLKKVETGLRTQSAGIPCRLLLRIQAVGLPTSGRLYYRMRYVFGGMV